jgi:hypothetical protein
VPCANPACDRPLPALVVREGDAYCRRSCLVAVEGDPWRRDDEEADVGAVGAGAAEGALSEARELFSSLGYGPAMAQTEVD